MSKISKHQREGKHSLDYDIIFMGRKDTLTEENDVQMTDFQDTFQYDPGSSIYDEAYNNDEFERRKEITRKVYEIIKNKTDINLETSRRKPSKMDFNNYFTLIKNELVEDNYTNVEIFNELAVYFSDNLFSIFKLLDNQWRNMIIDELQTHIGHTPERSTEINVKNLKDGSEIEFLYYDEVEEKTKNITGVILEYDKIERVFKVDSYENIYLVAIEDIEKILNNTKSRYNLNKLNNIDFL